MKHYSRVRNYQYGEKKFKFRYNYETNELEYVAKATKLHTEYLKEELKSSIAWLAEEAKRNLKSIEETGMIPIMTAHLSKYSWETYPNHSMDLMAENIMCELYA